MPPEVAEAAATRDTLGEGPVYVERDNTLCWVDILGKRWHALDLETGEVSTTDMPHRPTAFAPVAGGGFVFAFDRGLALCSETGEIERWLHEPEKDIATNRFNDGGTDPAGRFLAGTMNEDDQSPTGSLYQLDLDGSLRTLRSGLRIANTVAFSPDGRVMYSADSAAGLLMAHEYDPATGELGDPVSTFAPPADLPGVPDGSAVDAEGCLWNARWGGSCVVRLAPDGSLLSTLRVLVSQPTSCAFFGSDLYITSARQGLGAHRLALEPAAGSLFVARVDAEGAIVPEASKNSISGE